MPTTHESYWRSRQSEVPALTPWHWRRDVRGETACWIDHFQVYSTGFLFDVSLLNRARLSNFADLSYESVVGGASEEAEFVAITVSIGESVHTNADASLHRVKFSANEQIQTSTWWVQNPPPEDLSVSVHWSGVLDVTASFCVDDGGQGAAPRR